MHHSTPSRPPPRNHRPLRPHLRRALLGLPRADAAAAGAGAPLDRVFEPDEIAKLPKLKDEGKISAEEHEQLDAPIFFANADAFREEVLRLVREAGKPLRECVVSAEAIYDIDTTGIAMLEHLFDDLEKAHVRLLLARVRTNVRALMSRTGSRTALEQRIGSDNVHLTVVEAGRAYATKHGGPGLSEGQP